MPALEVAGAKAREPTVQCACHPVQRVGVALARIEAALPWVPRKDLPEVVVELPYQRVVRESGPAEKLYPAPWESIGTELAQQLHRKSADALNYLPRFRKLELVMKDEQTYYDAATEIALRGKAIIECEYHEAIYMDNYEHADAYRLANHLFTVSDPLVSEFTSRRALTDAVKVAIEQSGTECPLCEKWFRD